MTMHGAGAFFALGAVGISAFVISLLIAGIFLALAGKLVGIRNATLGRSIIAIVGGGILAGISAGLFSMVFPPLAPLVGFIVDLWVIKTVFDTDWIRAFLAWLFAIIIAGIVFGILAFLGILSLGVLSAV